MARPGSAPPRPGDSPPRARPSRSATWSAAKAGVFAILERELTVETGELTPSMKVKRRVVADNHAAVIESLYT